MSTAPARWSPGATLAWTFLVLAIFYAAEFVFLGIVLGASSPPGRKPGESEIAQLASNGDFIAAATFIADSLCVLALLAIVRAKPGATAADSLAVVPMPVGWWRIWIPALVAFAVASDALTWLLGEPVVPEFMQVAWASAGKVSLVIALVVVAPVMEELLFRGFLLSGLRPTRLGASGAVLASALLWSLIHGQYDVYGMASIFALGVLLGAARVKTGSVLVAIVMHGLSNAIATIETAVSAAGGG